MSATGTIVYFKSYSEGGPDTLTYPADTMGFGLLMGGVVKGQPLPPPKAVEHILLTIGFISVDLVAKALSLDEPAQHALVAKINELLIEEETPPPEKPKLILVPG